MAVADTTGARRPNINCKECLLRGVALDLLQMRWRSCNVFSPRRLCRQGQADADAEIAEEAEDTGPTRVSARDA